MSGHGYNLNNGVVYSLAADNVFLIALRVRLEACLRRLRAVNCDKSYSSFRRKLRCFSSISGILCSALKFCKYSKSFCFLREMKSFSIQQTKMLFLSIAKKCQEFGFSDNTHEPRYGFDKISTLLPDTTLLPDKYQR